MQQNMFREHLRNMFREHLSTTHSSAQELCIRLIRTGEHVNALTYSGATSDSRGVACPGVR